METNVKTKEQKRVTITRVFNAPRELVFKAWTEPKQMEQWWGPKGFTSSGCEMDVRPGGAIQICMDHPKFPNHWTKGFFTEVTPPEKIAFTFSAFTDDSGISGLEGINTITFEEENGKTKLTLVAVLTKLAPELAFAAQGMEQGWSESLDKLDTFITKK